jgi:hypothetical protein
MNQGASWVLLAKSLWTKKSRATVPVFFYEKTFSNLPDSTKVANILKLSVLS